MSIMITGGTGLLGSYLARHLIQEKGETRMVMFDMHPPGLDMPLGLHLATNRPPLNCKDRSGVDRPICAVP